jgi:hypothetical protein
MGEEDIVDLVLWFEPVATDGAVRRFGGGRVSKTAETYLGILTPSALRTGKIPRSRCIDDKAEA